MYFVVEKKRKNFAEKMDPFFTLLSRRDPSLSDWLKVALLGVPFFIKSIFAVNEENEVTG